MPITESPQVSQKKEFIHKASKCEKTQASDLPPQVGFKSVYETRKQDSLGSGKM